MTSEEKKLLIEEYNLAVEDLNRTAVLSRENPEEVEYQTLYHYCIGYIDALEIALDILGKSYVKDADYKATNIVDRKS